jgi:hypothetical protein
VKYKIRSHDRQWRTGVEGNSNNMIIKYTGPDFNKLQVGDDRHLVPAGRCSICGVLITKYSVCVHFRTIQTFRPIQNIQVPKEIIDKVNRYDALRKFEVEDR